MSQENPSKSIFQKIKDTLFGPAKDFKDPKIGHSMSLIALFAWVGLGADGLSSSAYGPEEAFRALGEHSFLAFFLVLATIFTIAVISYTYGKIIEHFPVGGGGYVVASALLGKRVGLVSGSALFVDYILTITISVAAGTNALFSLLPADWNAFKLPVDFAAIIVLMILNIRGIKESVTVLMPIFMTFVVTHLFLIGFGIFGHLGDVKPAVDNFHQGYQNGIMQLGWLGMFLLFMKAYSMGAGTYTGIEAISNGVSILREPRVKTGKRTMLYMALSLAITAGGLLICYMLTDIRHEEGKTLNAILAMDLFSGFQIAGIPLGAFLVLITMLSEALLLFVAAQAGFIDGPRILANMAVDGWAPKSFGSLSDRLTMQNGILLMGTLSIAALIYTGGNVSKLVIMYSINVFVTFTLSELGMLRYYFTHPKRSVSWYKDVLVFLLAVILCFGILCVMIFEKFFEGGWITLLVTGLLIFVCALIKQHYSSVRAEVLKMDRLFSSIPAETSSQITEKDFDPKKPTAVILVGSYNGLGLHIFLNIFRLFPKTFHNALFISSGVIDSEFFKDSTRVKTVEDGTKKTLERYVEFSKKMGVPASYEYCIDTDVVDGVSGLCVDISKKYAHTVFFAGEIVFEKGQWYHRILHNETAYAVLRRIRFEGLTMVMMPARLSFGSKSK